MRIAFIERIKAFIGGYFWIPCPNCGRMFGGHEKGGDLWMDTIRGKMTCADPECMRRVEKHNRAVWGAAVSAYKVADAMLEARK